MKHDMLMEITKRMPMKTILVNGQSYLERYFSSYTEDGGQWWYHRFLRSDSERHLHSHPWEGRSMVLSGWYTEQSRGPHADHNNNQNDHFRTYRVGQSNTIFENTLHRIVEIAPDTWTLIYVKSGRQTQWFFIDDEGDKKLMQSSPENWHLECGVRGD